MYRMTIEFYPLSLHDALPISATAEPRDEDIGSLYASLMGLLIFSTNVTLDGCVDHREGIADNETQDRKSTRLNSSHLGISYAVFCLKKKTDTTIAYENAQTHD